VYANTENIKFANKSEFNSNNFSTKNLQFTRRLPPKLGSSSLRGMCQKSYLQLLLNENIGTQRNAAIYAYNWK